MAQGIVKSTPINVNVLGGLVTNQNPATLPLGASPDCAEKVFLPGGVFTRPALKKVFGTPFGSATVTYAKSYVDPTGVIRNLYLDSTGVMWVENFSATPGTYTQLTAVPAGSYAKSITAFGREYIAISDGVHGNDIAFQYDGTHLDRVTQCGPGAPPNVVCVNYPAVNMVASGSTVTLTVSSTTYQTAGSPLGTYHNIVFNVTSGALGLSAGTTVVTSGNTNALSNGIFLVTVVNSDTQFVVAAINSATPAGTGGSAAYGTSATMIRTNNIVTVTTASNHNLLVGYQAQITGVTAQAVGGGINTITVDNEDAPGIATVTTNSAHGLLPGCQVSIQGVASTSVGGGITSIVRSGQVVTVTTASANGLNPGALVTISGVTTTSFNTTATVTFVNIAANTFGFIQVDVDASDSTGTVTLNWPVPDTPTPTFYEVISAPTTLTFQVQLFYPDATWTGGTVTFAWDGTFFVQSVPSSTTFTYQQYGPGGYSTVVGVVTPYGQVAPGEHQLQVSFLTQAGYTTPPSPPVKFTANGGQYISLSNIPIGPPAAGTTGPHIIARILLFTGAQGAYFFYIPTTPQVNGIIVGTATQINDNTTQNAVLDFSDNTLFSATGTSISGNNLANQVVIDSALGFAFYGSRLIAYGMRDQIQNLLNMSFDGGYMPDQATSGVGGNPLPNGWIASTGSAGALTTTSGYGYQFLFASSTTGNLSQSFYEDAYGAPIALPNTLYKVRFAIASTGAGSTVTFTISSSSTSFSSTATFTGTTSGGVYKEINFTTATPNTIPSDLILSVAGQQCAIDEISIIPVDSPFLDGMLASYVNNPEAFDGVSGAFGPVEDTHSVTDVAIVRDNLYVLTLDPGGRLHGTSQGITEPVGWVFNEVASNCGVVGPFATTRSQADDSSASGGEEWFSWMSSSGIRIFGGGTPKKISQEIQRPIGQTFPGAPTDLGAFNPAAQQTCWALNDPTSKTMYFGIPTGTATAPSVIFTLSYLGSDTAEDIAANAPVRRSLSGRMTATDLGRKWCPWNRAMNGAALMYRSVGDLQPVFFAGNGATPGASGFGNVYVLNPAYYTDDDYGQFFPYYVTAGIPDPEHEESPEIGPGIKVVTYEQSFIAGVGYSTKEIFVNSLGTIWNVNSGPYLMNLTPTRNMEWGGAQATGQRFFFKYVCTPNPAGSTPAPTTDNAFSITSLSVNIKINQRQTVAGSWTN